MKNIINKFYIPKIFFVIGGVGFLGKEICKAFCLIGSQVVILDKNKTEGKIFDREMKKILIKFSKQFN